MILSISLFAKNDNYIQGFAVAVIPFPFTHFHFTQAKHENHVKMSDHKLSYIINTKFISMFHENLIVKSIKSTSG